MSLHPEVPAGFQVYQGRLIPGDVIPEMRRGQLVLHKPKGTIREGVYGREIVPDPDAVPPKWDPDAAPSEPVTYRLEQFQKYEAPVNPIQEVADWIKPDAEPRPSDAELECTFKNTVFTTGIALGQLAASLGQRQADDEKRMRDEFLSLETSIFSSRLDRARVLKRYHDLYLPIKRWNEFLRIVGFSRATAYRLLKDVDDVTSQNETSAADKPERTEKQPLTYDQAIRKMMKILQQFSEADEVSLLHKLCEERAPALLTALE